MSRKPGSDWTGPDHELDHGSDHGLGHRSDHKSDHGSDDRKKQGSKEKKIRRNQIIYESEIIINKK